MKLWRVTLFVLVVSVAVAGYFVYRRSQLQAPLQPQPESGERVGDPPPADSAGLWALSDARVHAPNARAKSDGPKVYYSPTFFAVDDHTVTIQIIPESDLIVRSEDDIYRLRAKWVGTDLYWKSPYAQQGWSKLATFLNGGFEQEVNSKLNRYERIAPDRLPVYARPLLKKRASHDYSINMLDW
jgi:hypothetical protein